jgi:multidrug efflux pump subunit AcrB
MVTFANERLRYEGKDPSGAALAAGFTRLRPVVMTALAMKRIRPGTPGTGQFDLD